MKVSQETQLASQLEMGLGEYHWLAAAYDPSLRLRLSVCGMTTLALVNALQRDGFNAQAIISHPKIPSDTDMRHVFAQVEQHGETYIVDPTYSQFLDLAGLSPGYVVFGGEDAFPEKKIEVFKPEDRQRVAEVLARTAISFRMIRKPIDELQYATYPMEDYTYDEMVEEFSEIWNPMYFDPFVSNEPEMVKIVPKLASKITTEHIRLVA